MTPFRVQIRLRTPLLLGRFPVLLDGLIAGLVVRRAEDEGHPDPWSLQHTLPLARHEAAGEWVYQASQLDAVPAAMPHLSMRTSRASLPRVAEDVSSNLLALRRRKINVAGGAFRSTIRSLSEQWMESMTADGVGDIERVREILSELDYLGGGRSTGNGHVDSVDVHPIAPDECRWWRRPMQVPREGFVEAFCGLRPPYWKRDTHRHAWVPLS